MTENIDLKLKKSFQSVKEDYLNLKTSLDKALFQLDNLKNALASMATRKELSSTLGKAAEANKSIEKFKSEIADRTKNLPKLENSLRLHKKEIDAELDDIWKSISKLDALKNSSDEINKLKEKLSEKISSKELDRLSASLSALEKDIWSLQKKISRKESVSKDLSLIRKELPNFANAKDVSMLGSKIRELETSLHKIKRDVSSKLSEDKHDKDIEILHAINSDISNKLKRLGSYADYENDIRKIKAALDSSAKVKDIEHIEAELSALDKRIRSLPEFVSAREFNRLKESLKDTSKKIEQHEKENSAINDSILNLVEDIREINRKISSRKDYSEDIKKLKEKAAEKKQVEAIEKDIEVLANEIKQLKQYPDDMQKEAGSIKEKLKSIKKLFDDTRSEYEKENSAINGSILNLVEDIREINRKISSRKDYSEDIKKLKEKAAEKKQVEAIEKELHTALRQLSSAKEALKELDTRSEVKDLSRDIEELKLWLESLENTKASSSKLKELSSSIKELSSEIKSSKKELIELRNYNDVEELKSRIDELAKAISEDRISQETVASLRKDFESSRKEISSMLARMSDQYSENELIRNKFAKEIALNNSLYNEIRALNDALYKKRDIKADNAKLERKLVSLKLSKEKFSGKIRTAFGIFLAIIVLLYFIFNNAPLKFDGVAGKTVLGIIVLFVILGAMNLPALFSGKKGKNKGFFERTLDKIEKSK